MLAGAQRLGRCVVQQRQELVGLRLARPHVPRTRFHPVGDRRERLVELVRQAAGQLADGADAQRVRELGLPLPHLLLDVLAGLALPQGFLGPFALGDVLDGEQDEVGTIAAAIEGPRIEQHGARADRLEIVLHLEVVQHVLLRQDISEQRPQLAGCPTGGCPARTATVRPSPPAETWKVA